MKVKEINEEHILFDDGTKISFFHRQECCEDVYADFKALKENKLFLERDFEKIEIEKVKEAGFRINGFFVPCYNEQNGGYTDNLTLFIEKGEQVKQINITSSTYFIEK